MLLNLSVIPSQAGCSVGKFLRDKPLGRQSLQDLTSVLPISARSHLHSSLDGRRCFTWPVAILRMWGWRWGGSQVVRASAQVRRMMEGVIMSRGQSSVWQAATAIACTRSCGSLHHQAVRISSEHQEKLISAFENVTWDVVPLTTAPWSSGLSDLHSSRSKNCLK